MKTTEQKCAQSPLHSVPSRIPPRFIDKQQATIEMKKYILIIVLATALLTGCTSNKTTLDDLRAEISWNAFCAARGYDRNDNTYQATNEYLDTWCGSVDEEAAFIKAGLDPTKSK